MTKVLAQRKVILEDKHFFFPPGVTTGLSILSLCFCKLNLFQDFFLKHIVNISKTKFILGYLFIYIYTYKYCCLSSVLKGLIYFFLILKDNKYTFLLLSPQIPYFPLYFYLCLIFLCMSLHERIIYSFESSSVKT